MLNRPLGIIAAILLITLVFVMIRFVSDGEYRSALSNRTSGNATESAQGEVSPGIADTVNRPHMGQDDGRHKDSITNDELRTEMPVGDRLLAISDDSVREITNQGGINSKFAEPVEKETNTLGPEANEYDPKSFGPGPGEDEPRVFGPGPGENEQQVFGPGPGENEPQVFGPGPGENEPQVFGPGPGENEPQVVGPGPGENEPQIFGPGPGEDDAKTDDSDP